MRTLTLLAGLLALILLYNIAKQRGSRLAGLFAAGFVASDAYFIYYANYIHPDAFQLVAALCAFVVAVAHSRNGDRTSLIALGLLCGVVQGTKSGGVWTIPMALLAVWLGARARPRIARVLGVRVLVLGAAALVGFFVSTPYAFLDTYYYRSIAITYSIVTQNHLQLSEAVSLGSWAKTLYDYVGPIAAGLFAVTLARAVWVNRRGIADPALLLALVLAASQFVWYGTSVEVWHIVGYLVLGYGLLAVFAFETLFLGIRRLAATARRLPRRPALAERTAWVAAVAVLATVFVAERWFLPVSWAVNEHTLAHSTVRAANEWAIDHRVRPSAAIVFDDLAYFDPDRFPNARLHGGVLTWEAVRTLDPDYILLSQSLWGAAWMQELIGTQHLTRTDPNPFNVRLYQDLLATETPGPTKVPGIELQGVVRPAAQAALARQHSRIEGLANACDVCDFGVVDLRSELGLAAGIELRVRALAAADGASLVGPELRIYRVTRPL
jgi:4-amino-4-deoxy-L-arabinose transferase-like glycosyltransferase